MAEFSELQPLLEEITKHQRTIDDLKFTIKERDDRIVELERQVKQRDSGIDVNDHATIVLDQKTCESYECRLCVQFIKNLTNKPSIDDKHTEKQCVSEEDADDDDVFLKNTDERSGTQCNESTANEALLPMFQQLLSQCDTAMSSCESITNSKCLGHKDYLWLYNNLMKRHLNARKSSSRRYITTDNVTLPANGDLNEDEEKVLQWLVDLKLSSYFSNFQAHGYDMISIRAITPEDLNIMDIKKTGHRKKLLSKIAELPPTNELPRIKPDDVGSWLSRLNLQEYEQNFIDGGFDDIDFLKDLDKNDLEMIDIKKKGHQKKILMAVQQLSDLELTAILDEVVAETPRRGLSINGRSYSDQILQEFFPSNFPNINIASHVSQQQQNNNNSNNNNNNMYSNNNSSNNNLSEGSDHSPMQQRSPSTPVKKTPPPVAHRSSMGATPPKPKPKPKSVRANSVSTGTTTTTINGYYSSRSSTESLNEPLPLNTLGNGALNSSGEIQGDQDEIVSSTKSRNFFKEQERKASLSSQEGLDRKPSLTSLSSFDGSPTNTIRRNGSIVKNAPNVKAKPIISIPENGTNGYSSNTSPKPPPPAPPKRSDSIRHNGSYNGSVNGSVNGVNGHCSSSDEAPSLPLKHHNSPNSEDGCPSPPYPAPPAGFTTPINDTRLTTTAYANGIKIVPPPPVEVNGDSFDPSLKKRNSIDDAFGSTDDLLSDLMADIDDFSAQLDAMF